MTLEMSKGIFFEGSVWNITSSPQRNSLKCDFYKDSVHKINMKLKKKTLNSD